MADLALTRSLADSRHNVVRGATGRLVDHEQSVEHVREQL
jgi:hypothetical protein